MRILYFILSSCLSTCLCAQNAWYKNGEGFKSEFQGLKTGNFKGYISGILRLDYKNGEKTISSFSADSAFLDIIQDTNNIYDVSFKNYSAKNKELLLLYRTYGMANEIMITIENNEYYLSLIDGGCDLVIKGLGYEYVLTNDNYELLILHFESDVGLCSTKYYSSPELFIKKGSTLIFWIKKFYS